MVLESVSGHYLPTALFAGVLPIEKHADFLRRRGRKGMTPDDLDEAGAN